jgi:hypothetical protein
MVQAERLAARAERVSAGLDELESPGSVVAGIGNWTG